MRLARLTQILSWAFALCVIGYPLAGLLAVFINVSSWVTSYSFRAVVAVLTLALIWRVNALPSQGRAHVLITVFWILYVVRLLWDSLLGSLGAADALLFFILTVVIPVAALMRGSVHWDEVHAAKVIFFMGSTICGAGLMLGLGIVATERMLSDITTRLFLDTVNPITFANTGVTTLLSAATLLYRKTETVSSATLTAGLALAIGCIVLAASRGPLVSLVVCAIVLSLVQNRWAMLALLAALGGALASSGTNPEILTRFEDLKHLQLDASSLERVQLQANSLQMFKENPLFGANYAEFEMNTYPHNVFIETAMALGAIGLLPMIAMTLLCFRNTWRLLRIGHTLLPLLFFQYFIGFQFSGALWGATAYWACSGLVLCTSPEKKRRKAPAPAIASSLSNRTT